MQPFMTHRLSARCRTPSASHRQAHHSPGGTPAPVPTGHHTYRRAHTARRSGALYAHHSRTCSWPHLDLFNRHRLDPVDDPRRGELDDGVDAAPAVEVALNTDDWKRDVR